MRSSKIGMQTMTMLKLNREVYKLNIIRQAICAYSNLCTIEIREKPREYLLEFSNCLYDPERTMMEFENYLIGLENQ